MKRILMGVGTLLLAGSMGLMAQKPGAGAGTGPGPCCDQNKDGKCDMCGRAVGQGRGQGRRMGRGYGRGAGQGCWRNSQQTQTPPPAQAPAPPAPEAKK